MTLELYLWCALLFFVGQGIALFLIDIPEVRKLAKTANHGFIWKEWWLKDWNVVIGVQLIGIVAFAGLDQLIHWKPWIIDYSKWMFAIFGVIASGIAARIGGYRKMILRIIDRKTDIADGKELKITP
jgi:hypothetical protein